MVTKASSTRMGVGKAIKAIKLLHLQIIAVYKIAKKMCIDILTRKLSCRKDDRAMRPMYGCPEKFRESLTMPVATFPEIFNGLLFRSSR